MKSVLRWSAIAVFGAALVMATPRHAFAQG